MGHRADMVKAHPFHSRWHTREWCGQPHVWLSLATLTLWIRHCFAGGWTRGGFSLWDWERLKPATFTIQPTHLCGSGWKRGNWLGKKCNWWLKMLSNTQTEKYFFVSLFVTIILGVPANVIFRMTVILLFSVPFMRLPFYLCICVSRTWLHLS